MRMTRLSRYERFSGKPPPPRRGRHGEYIDIGLSRERDHLIGSCSSTQEVHHRSIRTLSSSSSSPLKPVVPVMHMPSLQRVQPTAGTHVVAAPARSSVHEPRTSNQVMQEHIVMGKTAFFRLPQRYQFIKVLGSGRSVMCPTKFRQSVECITRKK
jgi:hypothetical protein